MFYCCCIFIRSYVHIDSPLPVTWSQTVSQPVTTAPLDTLVDAVRGTSPLPFSFCFSISSIPSSHIHLDNGQGVGLPGRQAARLAGTGTSTHWFHSEERDISMCVFFFSWQLLLSGVSGGMGDANCCHPFSNVPMKFSIVSLLMDVFLDLLVCKM